MLDSTPGALAPAPDLRFLVQTRDEIRLTTLASCAG
jgi:hypothetical protein